MSNLPFVLTFLCDATRYGSKGNGFIFGALISDFKSVKLFTFTRKVTADSYSVSCLRS